MIDSHAHYDNERFDADREKILAQAFQSGVTHIVNPGCDLPSSRKAIAMAEAHAGLFAAVGFHPHEASAYSEGDAQTLLSLARHPKVVAIGEIGLDYHYDFSPRDVQKQVLRAQIELARQVGKPVILHDREAHGDVVALVREEKAGEVGGVFHCWSGSRETAELVLRMGFHIGVGGSVTFKNAHRLQEVVRHIPIDRLLIETDCPYMTPEPFRGRRNWSGLMVHVLEKLSELRGETVAELEARTTDNAIRLFRLPRLNVEDNA